MPDTPKAQPKGKHYEDLTPEELAEFLRDGEEVHNELVEQMEMEEAMIKAASEAMLNLSPEELARFLGALAQPDNDRTSDGS